MRVVIQRVSQAAVHVNQEATGKIGRGLLVFVGITDSDSATDIEWLTKKISQLRIFSDNEGQMNLSVNDIEGEILVISQFTLFAKTKKGNRPSFIHAAKPDIAIPLYEQFKISLNALIKTSIQNGIFGADMEVSLINDGPVTITIDSKNKE